MLRLVKTSVEQQDQVLALLSEWKEDGSNIVPTTINKDTSDFDAYVKRLLDAEDREKIEDGWVPSTTYWLTDGDELLGAANIRHELNAHLLNFGGHIGYGIKPSARGRGLATEQLRLALEKAKELGIERALITCDRENVASRQVILNNGGVADTPYTEEGGNVVERFWIDVKG
ncbi:GNAT family N-acetyltransferase [Exiguobacterium sp. SH1S21]|uniref:GNAT family N-acetyltransferase n=1 Tax=Exiguobacterium sp. SH1S21 TaxID=2510953 RepID=UPI00103D68A5|nr:GNAT family N-acetyltransferase [Exiguobacterium sp. SH1S21]TCI57614.1 GNAT family N-acetyltransferase [Exiguobacterium sp. SH1S21]